jgi:WD40 repeat protein/tRNA A-37 threonylcarbamoyl transferase component Bud32
MAVKLNCPNPSCGKACSVPEEHLGRRVRCPHCGKPMPAMAPTVDEPSHLKPPTDVPGRISRFEVRSRLGAGAFGTVYRAFDPQLEREVALKVPRAGTLDSRQRVERFLREARAVGRLRHPHIVPVFDAGRDGELYYIASAFIAGRPLSDAVPEQGMGPRQAAQIVRDLAEAVAYAHSQGVVHRDIKPANVMLDEKGEPHLMDFGLAARQDSAEKLTHDGAILGTPAYMAPEQAIGQKGEAQPAGDQYSLGVVLFELLTGRTPFEGPPTVLLFHAVKSPPPSPRSIKPQVPRDLETICLKALSKRAEDRYAGCQALADDLRRWQEGQPIMARRLGPAERLARWCRREPALALTSLVAVLGLVAVAVIAMWSAAKQTKLADAATREAERARNAEKDAEERRRDADREQQRATQEQRRAERRLCESHLVRALHHCEQGETNRGLLWLAEALDLAERAGLTDLEPVLRANLAVCSQGMWEMNGLLVPYVSRILTVGFTRDGKRLLTSDWGAPPRLWDVATQKALPVPEGIPTWSHATALHPDGKTFAVSWGDKARQGDLATGKMIDPILQSPPVGRVWSLAYSPDGKRLASACPEGVRQWDVATGHMTQVPIIKTNIWVRDIAYSPDGKKLAIVKGGGGVGLWDAETGQPIDLFPYQNTWSVAFAPDGTRLAIGNADGTVRQFDVATRSQVGPTFQHKDEVLDLAYSPDGNYLLTASGDRTARVLDAATLTPLGPPLLHRNAVWAAAFGPDSRIAATGGDDRAVRLWRQTAQPVRVRRWSHRTDAIADEFTLVPKQSLNVAAFSPDGKLVLTACGPELKLWDADTGAPHGQALIHPRNVHCAVFSPDGKLILTGSGDKKARLWDVATGALRAETAAYPKAAVQSAAFSPDGRRFATGPFVNAVNLLNGEVRLWDVATCKPIGVPMPVQANTQSLAFNPDGNTLVTGVWVTKDPGEVRAWDGVTGQPRTKPLLQPGGAIGLAFTPDGRRVFVACDDGSVRRWDATTWEPEATLLLEHPRPVSALTLSRDGRTVLTGSLDGGARLWDARTGLPLGPPLPHPSPVNAVSIHPDGRTFLIGCEDGTIEVHTIPAPLTGDAARIKLWAQVATNLRLDASGAVRLLDGEEWQRDSKKLKELGGSPLR